MCLLLSGGSGRGGNGGGSSHHSGRPTGTLATRQARTVGFVDLDPNTYRASQQLPAYLHSMIRSNIGSSSIDSDNYNLDRNSRSSSSSSSISHEGLIPRCRSGQTSAECLSRVLRRVGQMLEMERDRRTVFADDYYSV